VNDQDWLIEGSCGGRKREVVLRAAGWTIRFCFQLCDGQVFLCRRAPQVGTGLPAPFVHTKEMPRLDLWSGNDSLSVSFFFFQ